MEALMNPPSLSGSPTFRNVTSRLQALVVPRPRVVAEQPESASEVRGTTPYGVHRVRAPMSQVIARTSTTPAAVAPWWMTMVVVPAVAVVSAIAMV